MGISPRTTLVDRSLKPDAKAVMRQLTESTAEKLSPELATELVCVLDLEARWDALLADKIEKDNLAGLRSRRKAHDAFQSAWQEFAAKYPRILLPAPTQTMPDRLAIWCGVLRVVFGQAGGVNPTQVMGKVYRFADRIATKMNVEPVVRTPTEDLAGAVRELGIVIAWCNRLFTQPGILRMTRTEEAA